MGEYSPRPPDGEAPPRLCLFRSLQTAVCSSVVVDKRLLRGERLQTGACKRMRGGRLDQGTTAECRDLGVALATAQTHVNEPRVSAAARKYPKPVNGGEH